MKLSTILFACVALTLSCKKKDEEAKPEPTPAVKEPGAAKPEGGATTLNGSGSTFQKSFQEIAIEGFSKMSPNIKVNYGGGGSGKGRQEFADKVTDYGCTDAPYNDTEKAKIKDEFLYVPILLGAITVSYNLDGVDKLQLSPETIAKIFERDIKKWNDKAIAADNPGVKLPATDIVVAHRSDGSGTTAQFTLYLDTAATGTWKLKNGSTVEWPADTQAGNGNAGVAQIVKGTKGAIGYVDLPDAKASGLKYATVKNQAGKYIEPSTESAKAAGDGIDVKPDLTYVSVNAKGDAAYPITAPTWCMVYTKAGAKAAALKSYFKYMVTDAQAQVASIDFAPLPKSLHDKAVAAVDKIQ
jgi:phosphate transport system substrate-binding protein